MFRLFKNKAERSKDTMLAEADKIISDLRDTYISGLRNGNPVSQTGLAEMYRDGVGCPQDDGEAVRLYTLAAEQGYVDAQYELGILHVSGECTPQNDNKAFEWFHLAAEQGDIRAQKNIGLMYVDGVGVNQDLDKGVNWLTLAARKRNVVAQYNLGELYEAGIGVPQDDELALMWFILANIQGYEKALEKMHELGKRMTRTQLESSKARAEQYLSHSGS